MEWKSIGFTAAGILTSALASLVPEFWLPWVLYVACVCFCILCFAAWNELRTNRAGRRAYAIATAGAVVTCFLILRFVWYGGVNVSWSDRQFSVRPGEMITVAGRNLPSNHPNELMVAISARAHPEQEFHPPIAGVADGLIKIELPQGLTSGENILTITGPLSLPVLSNATSFGLSILGEPAVLSAVPLGGEAPSGRPGDTIVIKGTGFDLRDSGRSNHVFFGSAWAAARAGTKNECRDDDPCLVTTVPEDAPIGQFVDVAVAMGHSEPAPSGHLRFEVLGAPTIDEDSLRLVRGFRQRGQFAGTEIEIKGRGFDPSPTARARTQVLIGRSPATLTSWSQTSLRVQIPADASDGRVEVRIRGLSVKSEKAITLLGLPIIDHFEAQSAHAGDQVEVFGYNFDLADVTVNQVAIGGSAAPVVDARALLISP